MFNFGTFIMETESPVQETVYGTNTSSSSDDNHVMSERVQSLAGSIYQEFERMIGKYDEDVVKQLMPLVVSVLEHLDLAYVENQEHEVEIELLREDNEQLVTQFEREKQLRKASEQRLLELEYSVDDDRRELQGKVESLESIVRMFELKAKNAGDHAVRLEEKEVEMKKEYAKLHERYTELFKTHMDYMERTSILFGADKAESIATKIRQGMNLAQLKSGVSMYSMNSEDSSLKSLSSPTDFPSQPFNNEVSSVNKSIKSELQDVQSTPRSPSSVQVPIAAQRGCWTDGFGSDLTDISISSPDVDDITELSQDTTGSKTTVKSEERRPNTLYQELSFQDIETIGEPEESTDIAAPDSFFGMGKEVENLIMENNELLATKNALNIVKDDLIAKVDELTSEMDILQEEIKSLQAVKEHLKQRVCELEEELKRTKEDAEKAKLKSEEDEIPMAQRKRFTRVEMARVLMERNQYKERLMELQEAVRWTEMIRASRLDPTLDSKKNQSSIRKFFSNLFSSSEKPVRKQGSYHSSPHGSPALDSSRLIQAGERHKNLDFLDSELASERLHQQRAKERREQYKQVRAHVLKDGQVQAYGWSLPTKNGSSEEAECAMSGSSSVPVPIYCRPLMDKEPGMKIWCAAGVNLSGGRTADGGFIVGASVFYLTPPETEKCVNVKMLSEVEKLDHELKEQDKSRREHQEMEQNLSSLVWIATSTHSSSKINIIDASNPGDVLSTFYVCTSHLLCIASVPGATECDYPVDEDFSKLGLEANNSEAKAEITEENCVTKEGPIPSKIGNITFVSCSAGSKSSPPSPVACKKDEKVQKQQWIIMKDPTELVKDGVSEVPKENQLAYDQVENMSSVLPTMWMGAQSGSILIHSSVAQWWRCIQTVKLKDAVLSIVHFKGRVFASMANGTVAIFHRASDGQWDLTNYHILDFGYPHHSIRCMIVVHNKIWCGYCNCIYVVDPKTLTIEKSFDAHPRKESQVRQMTCLGDGVWVSIRLDSTLRLYHAHTHKHLQDIDIEPYVSKILGTGRLGFSFVRITALTISCGRLWVGTGNGVIISVPVSEEEKCSITQKTPSSSVKIYTDSRNNVTPGSFIPYCSMAQAQLSYHGHRDAVKFFVAVPKQCESIGGDKNIQVEQQEMEKQEKLKCIYVLSGGEGYIDFHIGDDDDDDSEGFVMETAEKTQSSLSKNEQSHLIVWEVKLDGGFNF